MTYLCFTQCLKEKRNHFTIHHCDSLNSILRKKNQFDHLCLSLSLFLRTMLEQKIWTENHKLPAITSDSRALLTTYGKCPDKLFFSTTWLYFICENSKFFSSPEWRRVHKGVLSQTQKDNEIQKKGQCQTSHLPNINQILLTCWWTLKWILGKYRRV